MHAVPYSTGGQGQPVAQGEAALAAPGRLGGPVGTADVVTVLASQVASLLAANAGPDGDPEALFDTMIRAQVDMIRRRNAIEKERTDG